jgi:hypothetical protein
LLRSVANRLLLAITAAARWCLSVVASGSNATAVTAAYSPISGIFRPEKAQITNRKLKCPGGHEGPLPEPASGDLDALVAVLDPDVAVRSDGGTAHPEVSVVLHGAAAVAAHGLKVHQPSALFRPALVNGAAGMVVTVAGKPVAVIGFTVSGGKVVALDVIADPDRLLRFSLAVLD